MVDELALLVGPEDVHCSREGRTSVDPAIGPIALGGAYLAAVPSWLGAVREVLATRRRAVG